MADSVLTQLRSNDPEVRNAVFANIDGLSPGVLTEVLTIVIRTSNQFPLDVVAGVYKTIMERLRRQDEPPFQALPMVWIPNVLTDVRISWTVRKHYHGVFLQRLDTHMSHLVLFLARRKWNIPFSWRLRLFFDMIVENRPESLFRFVDMLSSAWDRGYVCALCTMVQLVKRVEKHKESVREAFARTVARRGLSAVQSVALRRALGPSENLLEILQWSVQARPEVVTCILGAMARVSPELPTETATAIAGMSDQQLAMMNTAEQSFGTLMGCLLANEDAKALLRDVVCRHFALFLRSSARDELIRWALDDRLVVSDAIGVIDALRSLRLEKAGELIVHVVGTTSDLAVLKAASALTDPTVLALVADRLRAIASEIEGRLPPKRARIAPQDDA